MKEKVSIEKSKELKDISSLKASLEKLIFPFGGIENIVGQNQVVLLKPNLVSAARFTSGAITNPYLVKALAELILEQTPQRLIIADGSSVGTDTQRVFSQTAYLKVFQEMLNRGNAEFVDFKKGEFVRKKVPGGKVVKKLRVPVILRSVDTLINLPVLKTHDSLPITLGVKNMKGIIHENMKKKFHHVGLAQAIVDLHKLVSPDFTIYDGTVAMEGLGPVHGDPVNLGLLLAAEDVIAGDLVAASIMGFDKQELEFLKLAEEQEMGTADWEDIEVVGENLRQVTRPFERFSLDSSYYRQMGLRIKGAKGCSGCRHTLDGVVKQMGQELNENQVNKTVYLGPQDKIGTSKDQTILIGTCLRPHRDKGTYIGGCPPHVDNLKGFLKKELSSK